MWISLLQYSISNIIKKINKEKAILLGDNISDTLMAPKNKQNILKIGFLNNYKENIREELEKTISCYCWLSLFVISLITSLAITIPQADGVKALLAGACLPLSSIIVLIGISNEQTTFWWVIP